MASVGLGAEGDGSCVVGLSNLLEQVAVLWRHELTQSEVLTDRGPLGPRVLTAQLGCLRLDVLGAERRTR